MASERLQRARVHSLEIGTRAVHEATEVSRCAEVTHCGRAGIPTASELVCEAVDVRSAGPGSKAVKGLGCAKEVLEHRGLSL